VWVLIGVLGGIAGLFATGWAGLHVWPKPFPSLGVASLDLGSVPIPVGLPQSVARYYRAVCGDEVPRVHSAVVSGLARLRVLGIRFPGRFRFVHRAGRDYRHYIELTFFGRPIFRVNEFYLGGESRLELPFGVTEGEPKVAQAANLGLWGESFWFPSILLSDPRVRWEAVDERTARLVVPFGGEEDRLTVRFDRKPGRVRSIEAMRFKDKSSAGKTLWRNEIVDWMTQDGWHVPAAVRITWQDDVAPWAEFHAREVVLNADVSELVQRRGP